MNGSGAEYDDSSLPSRPTSQLYGMRSSTINGGDLPEIPPPSTTVVKYEKSSCLFCNDWFDAQTFTVSFGGLIFSRLYLNG